MILYYEQISNIGSRIQEQIHQSHSDTTIVYIVLQVFQGEYFTTEMAVVKDQNQEILTLLRDLAKRNNQQQVSQ